MTETTASSPRFALAIEYPDPDWELDFFYIVDGEGTLAEDILEHLWRHFARDCDEQGIRFCKRQLDDGNLSDVLQSLETLVNQPDQHAQKNCIADGWTVQKLNYFRQARYREQWLRKKGGIVTGESLDNAICSLNAPEGSSSNLPPVDDAAPEGGDTRSEATRPEPSPQGTAEPEERYVFRPDGKIWELRFEDEKQSFPTLRGFEHIHRLMQSPGKAIPATELMPGGSSQLVESTDDGGPAETAEGRQKIRERLEDIRLELERFEPLDEKLEPGKTRIPILKKEQTQLLNQWNGGKEPGARAGNKGIQKTPGDKAADKVRKAVDRVYGDLVKPMPKLLKHLQEQVDIGKRCEYKVSNIRWSL